MHLIDPLARQIEESGKVVGRLSHFVSKRPIWLAEAAEPVIAWSPTTQRVTGSRHSRSELTNRETGEKQPNPNNEERYKERHREFLKAQDEAY